MRVCVWALAGLALVACDRPSEATPAATATASPPATAVEVSPTSRPLGQAEVDAKVKEATPALQNACAEALGAVGDKVMLSVIAEIDERGHVIDATLAGGGGSLRPLRRCLAEEIRELEFGLHREGGTFTAMIELQPTSEPAPEGAVDRKSP